MSSIKKVWMKERLAKRRWTRYSRWTGHMMRQWDWDWWAHIVLPMPLQIRWFNSIWDPAGSSKYNYSAAMIDAQTPRPLPSDTPPPSQKRGVP